MTDLEKLAAWAAKRRADFAEDVEWAERRNDAEARGRAIGRVSAYDEVAFVARELAAGRDVCGVTA